MKRKECDACWGQGLVTCKERPGINGRKPIFTCPKCKGKGVLDDRV